MKVFPDSLAVGIDFPQVIERVWSLAHTPGGRDLIRHLAPQTNPDWIERSLRETDQILAVLQSGAGVPAMAFEEVQPAFTLLKVKNAVLSEDQFMNLKNLAQTYETVYRFLERNKELTEDLWLQVRDFAPLPQVSGMIEQVFDLRGMVRSNASPLLAKLRDLLAKKKLAADRIFYRSLGKYQSRGLLADFGESVMDDRRVMAVQAQFKGQVSGLFHGSSAKSSIVFVEPSETVEINNEIASLIEEEKREVYRILKELTAHLPIYLPQLQGCETRICYLDFVTAKARYAFQTGGCLPQWKPRPGIKLIDAVNPVLHEVNKARGKATVPLSVELRDSKRLLVISGPNAGGKSIALKTVALLQTMLQSGMLVPVHPRSELGLFHTLAGDIGDAQSIENELSTYSSRLEKMKVFLELANDRALFVIDEFGSGSDPELGSALAVVFLKELAAKGVYGIATTHYQRIKAAAGELPGVENGSMEFDLKTFEPLFRLHVGHPGSSYTFEVAERVGIPAPMVKAAKASVDKTMQGLDALLTSLQQTRLQLTRDQEALRNRLQSLETGKAKNAVELTKLEEKLRKQAEVSQENNRLIYLGRKLDDLLQAYVADSSDAGRKKVGARFWAWIKKKAGEESDRQKAEQKKVVKRESAKLKQQLEEPIAVGDAIKLLGTKQVGVVRGIKKDKYLVQFGNLQTTLERARFIKADKT